MRAMLQRFLDSFTRAIRGEMDAMRQRLGPFEVPLTQGVPLESEPESKVHQYAFRVSRADDRLVGGSECSLVAGARQSLVTLTEISGTRLVLRSEEPIDLQARPLLLAIYPWFLYQRLLGCLHDLGESDGYYIHSALATFGKAPARHFQTPAAESPAASMAPAPMTGVAMAEWDASQLTDLNASQQRALQLCHERSPAFVWGPPGTGKTTTLSRIVLSLMGQGLRVLVTSTTHAAVDQVLAHLARMDSAQEPLDKGLIVRLGQTQASTFGASLHEVVDRVHARKRDQRERLEQRQRDARIRAQRCGELLGRLDAAAQPQQLGLFGEQAPTPLTRRELESVFRPFLAARLHGAPVDQLRATFARRRQRLERVGELARVRSLRLAEFLLQSQAAVVREARAVLATMTHVYLSRPLQSQRFDVVIVEEAGMAVLPTLFYCASLARERVVLVGDPRQLPPIVQSPSPYVHRAMGRSIFQVTVPEPHHSDLVVMLDTQYRMHPVIGELVSGLFYDGCLQHSPSVAATESITARAPYPGHPVVVVDTAGQSRCATPQGSFSRYNETTARHCVDLAAEAVRAGIQSVAVITPYVEQSRLIRRLLPRDERVRQRVECRTVHRFQGGERDLVILDTVDTAPYRPGVLLAGGEPGSGAANLINVSISRARGKLVIIADVEYFHRQAEGRPIDRMLQAAIRVGERSRGACLQHGPGTDQP